MKVVSLSVGGPRTVDWNGGTVLTSIFKTPTDRRLKVTALNIEGDKQSDLSVHGGYEKAVYAYPSEHYPLWRNELGEELPWASFGENLTTEGLFEDVRIGDRFRIGSAEFIVTQPRMPCYKLGIKFGRSDIVQKFLASERSGFYFAVLKEGEVGVGDPIERMEKSERSVRVSDITQLYTHEKHNVGLLRRAIEVEALPESWKIYFQHRLEKLTN